MLNTPSVTNHHDAGLQYCSMQMLGVKTRVMMHRAGRDSTYDQLQVTALTISGRIFPFASVFSIVSCPCETCLLEHQVTMTPRTAYSHAYYRSTQPCC